MMRKVVCGLRPTDASTSTGLGSFNTQRMTQTVRWIGVGMKVGEEGMSSSTPSLMCGGEKGGRDFLDINWVRQNRCILLPPKNPNQMVSGILCRCMNFEKNTFSTDIQILVEERLETIGKSQEGLR